MFFIYQIIVTLILLISPIIITYRLIKNKEDRKRFKEKLSVFSKKRVSGKLIWFHGASVGEILSIIPLIEYYEKNKFVDQILVTSSTLSSSKILNKFKFKKTIHQFYPIDHILLTSKFLDYWEPNVAIFIDSEIWPCMFKSINAKEIPLILLNARITKKTYLKWKSVNTFAEKVFNKITIAHPQNLETKSYLKQFKVKNIKTIGNLKFAETNDLKIDRIENKLKSQLKKKKIWVASSTHPGEEVFCAKTHINLKKKFKNLLTIIIPRHVHRVKEITNDLENLNLNVVTHSSKNKDLKDVDIYIVDTFGETKKFHKIGCSVLLGGSIVDKGGQNPLEATRFGARILHGPNIDNFKDVYKALSLFKISKKVKTIKELASLIVFKKNKNKVQKIIKIGRKILKETIKDLDKIINNEFKKT